MDLHLSSYCVPPTVSLSDEYPVLLEINTSLLRFYHDFSREYASRQDEQYDGQEGGPDKSPESLLCFNIRNDSYNYVKHPEPHSELLRLQSDARPTLLAELLVEAL
jgi:hypothetical protein